MKTNREFANRVSYTKFLDGVKEILSENQLRKVKLLRLSIKTTHKGKRFIESIWGFVGRKLMAKFVINLPNNNETMTSGEWKEYGSLTAKDFNEWYSSEGELDTLDRKFEAIQFDVWKTSPDWDLAQDLIDDVELELSTHINGKFHWRVRKALVDAIANLAERSRKDHENNLTEKENIDLLKEIIQKSPITLKITPSKSKVAEKV